MGKLFSKESLQISRYFEINPPHQSFTEDSIQSVLKDLEENTQNINEIFIGKHTYDDESLSLLTNAIQECQNIRIANFSEIIHDTDQPETLEILNSTLLCLHNLYEVNLSQNSLTEDTIDIFSFLFHSDNLKAIKLNNNLLGVEGAMKLAEAFRNSELKLYVFCAEGNYFEDHGVIELAESFSNMKSLRQLNLSRNRIGKEGITALCKGMTNNPELQVLDICDNYINEEAAYCSLKQLLENLTFLSQISLNDCLLGNGGAKMVMKALNHSNIYIRELYLGYNEIDDTETGELIVKLLKKRKLLDHLELGGNDFSYDIMKKIKDAGEFFVKDTYYLNLSDSDSESSAIEEE